MMQITACWRCHAAHDTLHFCPHCNAIQPLSGDPFTCLGFSHRLNLDLPSLTARFHDLSRKFHPDFYQQKSSQEQAISLSNAALLNSAYRTLKNPQKRIEYLIRRVEGGNAIPTEAPSDLFEAIFEMEEALDGMKAAPHQGTHQTALRTAQEKFAARLKEENDTLAALSVMWDTLLDEGAGESSGGSRPAQGPHPSQGWTEKQSAVLTQIKQTLSHQAYLERILSNLAAALPPAASG